MSRRFPHALLFLALLLILAGCRVPIDILPSPSSTQTIPPKQSTPAPSPSPSPPTSTPIPTPTLAPSPTPTPSPTPIPAVAPTVATTAAWSPPIRQALLEGDYERAIAALERFLAAPPDANQAIEARFLLAQAYLAAERNAQAAAILDALIENEDATAQFPEIHYWLARTLLSEDPARAAQAFEAYAALSPHLAAAMWIRAGDAWRQAGALDQASAAYAQALGLATDIPTALHAREGLAETALAAEDLETAIRQYEAILQQARSPTYRTEILYRLGRAQEAAGRTAEAWANYHQATRTAPASPYAYQALVALVDAAQAVDPLLRAEIDIATGADAPIRTAISVLNLHLEATPEDRPAQAYALLAQAYEKLDDYAQSETAWQRVLALATDEALRSNAWLGLGRSYWRRGMTGEARDVYLQAAEASGDPETAATALWWAAVLAGQDETLWQRAAEDFIRLARTYPQSDYAAQAGFRAGLIHYRLGDEDAARTLWSEHAAAGRTTWHAAADFWLGKLLWAQGAKTEALTHWRGVAQRWGVDNFYGVRARQKLIEAGAAPPPLDSPPEDAMDAVAAWVMGLKPGAPEADLTQTPPQLAPAAEWHRLGEREQAHGALERLRLAWAEDPARLYQLALFAQDKGYDDVAIRAALRLVNLSGRPLIEAPRRIQEWVYPTPYRDLTLNYAQRFHLDPARYFALIRQESLFWASAASPVGAQGLTQIMPDTARGAASQLGMTDFTLADLQRPVVSLYLGAYLLSQELARGRGDVFWALAAYNAGPGSASFWRDLAPGDEDLFVELIAYRETQHYVRTITVQTEHYRRLYPHLSKQSP